MTKDNIHDALRAYEHVRKPFVTNVLKSSTEVGELCQLRSEYGGDEDALVPALKRQWDWVFGEDAKDQASRALKWMNEQQGVTA